jgi:hypothetical protein
MERSEGVTATLALIMKMMDGSNDSLLRSINPFEGFAARVEANPKARQSLANIPMADKPVPPQRHRSPAAAARTSPFRPSGEAILNASWCVSERKRRSAT